MLLRRMTKHRILFGSSLLLLISAGLAVYLLFEPSSILKKTRFEKKQEKRAAGLKFRRLSMHDENGQVDPNGLRKARIHIEEMKKEESKRARSEQDEIQEAGIAPDSWQWLGPGNIGGRIRSIIIKPNNANDMLVGSVSGGIWRTTNGGASWFPVDDFMANLSVSTMIMHPTDSNILYAGTGEGFGNFDAIQGAGIFRSTNGGASWAQLAATDTSNFNFVNRLAISPNGATLLAATNLGAWRSTDNGASWTLISGAASQPQDIDFHPTDNNRAILGGNGLARFSINGGATWTDATFNPAITAGNTSPTNGRVELAYAPSNPAIVYASVNNNSGDLYRSTDGGQTYTRVNTGTNYLGIQGWYDNIVWVNPSDANFVIVGGIHLWRSTDGGTNLTQISDGSADSAHADHHVIVPHPAFNNNTNRTVFFGNDGGIHRADNVATVTNTTGWTELNNNLGITQFYGAAGNNSGMIIGGTQDNGVLRWNGGTENWQIAAGGDGGFVAADLTDSNFFYGENQNLAVLRSINGGSNWTQITNGLDDFTGTGCTNCRTNFIAPIALDPIEPQWLLAGGWSLWRTDNARSAAPQWSSIKPPTNAPVPPANNRDLRAISALTISPGSSNFIVVGHNNGDVFRTINGASSTPTWTKIDNPTNGLPDRMVMRLVIDNTRSPNWIYATFSGFSADNVYVSRDLGASWQDISGNGATGLPSVPVRTLAIHPHNRNLLYVGTEVGIFTSNDAGATWNLPNGGPSNVSVDELFWMGGDLLAATHGRGIYRSSGGIYVDCNHTGAQVGTFNLPYRTVNTAITAAARYTPIWLKPCNYNEQINTSKRLEIRSLGGTARIGTP